MPTLEELNPDKWTISPSQLNTFESCEKIWYDKYIGGIKEPTNHHMLRGTAVHKAIELLWKYKPISENGSFDHPEWLPELEKDTSESVDVEFLPFVTPEMEGDVKPSKFAKVFASYASTTFNMVWDQTVMEADTCFTELQALRDTSYASFMRYVHKQILNIEILVREKSKSYTYAYATIRPYRSEIRWYSKSGSEMGVVDAIIRVQVGDIIQDYKTSNPLPDAYSTEYKIQLSFYVYLYFDKYGKLPKYVEINYVLYDFIVRYEATMDMVTDIAEKLAKMRARLHEFKAGKLPYKNTEFAFCRNCFYGKKGFCDRKNSGQATLV